MFDSPALNVVRVALDNWYYDAKLTLYHQTACFLPDPQHEASLRMGQVSVATPP